MEGKPLIITFRRKSRATSQWLSPVWWLFTLWWVATGGSLVIEYTYHLGSTGQHFQYDKLLVLSSILSLLVGNRAIDIFPPSCSVLCSCFRFIPGTSPSPSKLSFSTSLVVVLCYAFPQVPMLMRAWVFLFGDILRTCLSHFRILDLTNTSIVLVFDFCLISSLLTFICQRTLRIFLRLLCWKTLSLFSSFFVILSFTWCLFCILAYCLLDVKRFGSKYCDKITR